MSNRKILFILITVILAVSLIFVFDLISFEDKDQFANRVKHCNEVDTSLRFSCFRDAIESHYSGSLEKIADWVEDNKEISFESEDSSYAIFGTNCHTFYHALGDYIATKGESKDLETLIDYGTSKCTSGYIMGLYKRIALDNEFDLDLLGSFYETCPKESRHSCAHEIGHILNDRYVSSILKILDGISEDKYSVNYPDYNYKLFKDPDLKSPFEQCDKLVPENEIAYCYTGVGHNEFLFSEFYPGGYKDLLAQCKERAGEHEENCYDFFIYRVGINDVATKFLSEKFAEGRDVCDEVVALANRPETKEDCYIGLGGGLGLFMESELASRDITEDNIRIIQEKALYYINLCEKSEDKYKTACYRGILGTGVKNLYKELNIQHSVVEKILPQINDDFEIVG